MNKVQEFLQKIAEDKALQEKMAAIMQGKTEEIEEKLTAFAQENEFEFTFDEFLKAVKGQEGEVNDEELDNVTGGAGFSMEELAKYLPETEWEEICKKYQSDAERSVAGSCALLKHIARGR